MRRAHSHGLNLTVKKVQNKKNIKITYEKKALWAWVQGWGYKKPSDSDITVLQFVFRVKYRVKVMYGVLFSSEKCESAFVCMCHVLAYIYAGF